MTSVELFGATRGQQNNSNQDAFYIGHRPFPVWAVADGAGNAQLISRKAVAVFTHLHTEMSESNPASLVHENTWKRWMKNLDSMLLGGNQTTFCGANIVRMNDKCYAIGASVGDTRLYLHSANGHLAHITEGARKSRLGSGAVDPTTFCIELVHGDTLLTCSDGAYGPMPMAELGRIVIANKMWHLSDVPPAIIERAAKHGLADDATIVVVRFNDVRGNAHESRGLTQSRRAALA